MLLCRAWASTCRMPWRRNWRKASLSRNRARPRRRYDGVDGKPDQARGPADGRGAAGLHAAEGGGGHHRSAAARHQLESRQIELAHGAGLPPGVRGRVGRHLDHHLPADLHLPAVDQRLEPAGARAAGPSSARLPGSRVPQMRSGQSCPSRARPAVRCRRTARRRTGSKDKGRRRKVSSRRGGGGTLRSDRPIRPPLRPRHSPAAPAPRRLRPPRWKSSSRRHWGRSRRARTRPAGRHPRPAAGPVIEIELGEDQLFQQVGRDGLQQPRLAGPAPP